MLCLELPEELNNRLELLSLSTGRTVQFYIHESILEYLDEVEDRYLNYGTERLEFSIEETESLDQEQLLHC